MNLTQPLVDDVLNHETSCRTDRAFLGLTGVDLEIR